tara:strand:- start:121 stop:819 length:699 start_codon:yes stop_codon:yes gene_type:complete
MLRSVLFKIVFYFGLISICIFFIPALFLPKKFASLGGRLTGYWAEFCVKFILSTNIEITGKENLNHSDKFFVACTHQSAFETFFLQTLLKSPFFLLKRELIRIPIFGLFLNKIGCISIERNKFKKENISLMDQISVKIKENENPLIIFPQGSRFSHLERPNFKKGVSRIYNLNLCCLPIVMNSGEVWPKKGRVLANKNIKISILKIIEPGMDELEFLNLLQNKMYDELDEIV